ncbi:hypothetical protein Dimus_039407 [Dionaea muscipula]
MSIHTDGEHKSWSYTQLEEGSRADRLIQKLQRIHPHNNRRRRTNMPLIADLDQKNRFFPPTAAVVLCFAITDTSRKRKIFTQSRSRVLQYLQLLDRELSYLGRTHTI